MCSLGGKELRWYGMIYIVVLLDNNFICEFFEDSIVLIYSF